MFGLVIFCTNLIILIYIDFARITKTDYYHIFSKKHVLYLFMRILVIKMLKKQRII
jgi:hypothetical protein